jgi:hypothetical protein
LWFSCEWFGKALAEHRADLAAGVLETSFLPGRSFSGPADFNTQLAEWLERVNQPCSTGSKRRRSRCG